MKTNLFFDSVLMICWVEKHDDVLCFHVVPDGSQVNTVNTIF